MVSIPPMSTAVRPARLWWRTSWRGGRCDFFSQNRL